jgi:hypothetical protein
MLKVIFGALGLFLGFAVSVPLAGDAIVALVYPHGGFRPGLLLVPLLSFVGCASGVAVGIAIERGTRPIDGEKNDKREES